MKESQVKNINNIEPNNVERDGNKFTIKAATDAEVLGKCTASFIEVEPGNYAFGYHYHEVNEEIFCIISGEGAIRTPKGEIAVKAGDAVSFPTGEGGAHVIRNSSATEKLVYIDFGTRSNFEIAHLIDAKKLMINTPFTNTIIDEV